MSKIRKYSAFTLIELIVVITILAILGTISFISFNSYSSSARDSARVSDLGSMSKALSVYQTTNGSLPLPSSGYTTITASGVTIGYQGYAGSSVTSVIGMNGGSNGKVQDPLDKIEYTYLVNSDKNKYQLLGFGERNDGNISFIRKNFELNKSIAADYTSRYPVFRGDKLGVILEKNNNKPLQENTSLHTTTNTFDVVTFSGAGSNKEVTAYFDKNSSVSGTGTQITYGILTYSQKDDSLVGYWNFDEGTGSYVNDYSGNGFNLELKSFTGNLLPYWEDGKKGKAMIFNGSNGVVINEREKLAIRNSFSISSWIKPTGIGSLCYITREYMYQVCSGSGSLYFSISNTSPGRNFIDTGYKPLNNQWVHVAIVNDSINSIVKTYVNGTQIYSTGSIGKQSTNSYMKDFVIGHRQYHYSGLALNGGYKGSIDEMYLYNRALSNSEIQALYNITK